jgi:6-pyruvoyltetrahydropterin/6-carboxytetrahydropterin synthase
LVQWVNFNQVKYLTVFLQYFVQHNAGNTHCRFVHGYGISFKIYFEGELDDRNWVWDFGGMKRAKTLIDNMQPKEWMDYMFDHTMIIAKDDPELEAFKQMDTAGVAQVRIIPATGAEKFAEYIYSKVNPFVLEETNNRVRVTKVKFMEHGKNAAYYVED